MSAFLDILEAMRSLFARERPDPKRFAPTSSPKNWHRAPDAAYTPPESGSTVWQPDERKKVFYFTDRPFAEEVNQELTPQDMRELARRKLNPSNPIYAAAKRMFSENPNCTRGDLHFHFPGASSETWKVVLAAFRAAIRSPIGQDAG